MFFRCLSPKKCFNWNSKHFCSNVNGGVLLQTVILAWLIRPNVGDLKIRFNRQLSHWLEVDGCREFHLWELLELIRAQVQSLFVQGDRWLLLLLLAAVAGSTEPHRWSLALPLVASVIIYSDNFSVTAINHKSHWRPQDHSTEHTFSPEWFHWSQTRGADGDRLGLVHGFGTVITYIRSFPFHFTPTVWETYCMKAPEMRRTGIWVE